MATIREVNPRDSLVLEDAALLARLVFLPGLRLFRLGEMAARFTISGLYPVARHFLTALAVPPGPSPENPSQTANGINAVSSRRE